MQWLRHRGLTLVLLGVFLGTWVGQFLSGHAVYNEERTQKGMEAVSLPSYLARGHFWQATGENWESEFLQMAMFVVLTCFLFQKGSPESRDPDDLDDGLDEDPRKHADDPDAPWPVRRGGWVLWVYERSLSFCFAVLFLASILIHAGGGVRFYNEEQLAEGRETVSFLGYMATSQFWFESFQNWQSEFLSLAAMVYLSVYLRQRGSDESKPVATPHHEHGE